MAIIFFRTLIIFFTLIVLMRILGKRQMGELELSELVVSVLIADIAAMPLQDIGIPLLNGLIPIVVLFACELVLSGITMCSVRLRAIICGKPCFLIKGGQILQKEMRKCRFTVDELTEELRSKGITDIGKVQFAVLETDGTLSAILMPNEQALTASMLGFETDDDDGYATVVIEDGRMLTANLMLTGHDENWLMSELKKRGISRVNDVYTMIVYDSGRIYFSGKEN